MVEPAAAPAARPVAILVFGILNIAWGIIGLITTAVGIVGLAAYAGAFDPNNPYHAAMAASPTYYGIVLGLTVVHLLASIVILAAGVGLLLNKNWARLLSMAWAIYFLLSTLINSTANWIWVMQDTAAQTDRSTPEGQGMYIGLFIGFFGCSCALLIYPILLLIFMSLPDVKAWLQRPTPANDPGFGESV